MTQGPKRRFGPDRTELWFWLFVSGGGLCLLAFAAWYRDMVSGLVGLELLVFGGAFFGYLFCRSVNRLFLEKSE